MRQVRTPARVAVLLTIALAPILAAEPSEAQVGAVGLSSVRAQRFGNEDLVGFDPQTGDRFAWSLTVGDFNGDGADDLATGIPFDDGIAGIELEDCGGVIIRYAIPGAGLDDNVANQFLRQTPDRDPAEAFDYFGSALAACDFNGDSFDDLAVGVPGEAHGGQNAAGAVNIYYGAANGLHGLADAFYTQSTAGIPGDVEEADAFGATLACGDFDGDGHADLAIGVPFENLPGGFGAGMLDVIPGSAGGLVPAGAYSLDQDSPGVGGGPDDMDQFASALASGNFNGDAFADLAIGVPGEDDEEGQIHVVFGSATGLTGAGSLFWSETAIGGLSESGDAFGAALTAGDFDGDAFDDLVIGIPEEDFGAGGSISNTGQVNVLYGAAGGFDLNRTQFWAQDNILGAGASEFGDFFGATLAAGDFDADGFDDLAVGSPLEFVTGEVDGAVTVWMGSAAGLSAARRREIAAGLGGIPGNAGPHFRHFGQSLAAGDFDGDGHADLAIGAPFEDENGIPDVGAETVLYGALFADGVETATTGLWSEESHP